MLNKDAWVDAPYFSCAYPNAAKFTELALCVRSENVFADTPQDGILWAIVKIAPWTTLDEQYSVTTLNASVWSLMNNAMPTSSAMFWVSLTPAVQKINKSQLAVLGVYDWEKYSTPSVIWGAVSSFGKLAKLAACLGIS